MSRSDLIAMAKVAGLTTLTEEEPDRLSAWLEAYFAASLSIRRSGCCFNMRSFSNNSPFARCQFDEIPARLGAMH